MYRIFLHFVIYSGNFIFFLLLSIFLQCERKRARADFYDAIHTPPNFFFFNACIFKALVLAFLLNTSKQFFFSRVSRVICVCLSGPRRFWFVLESAAVSYSDFV